ncbi:YciI family protein [Pseudonocardia sp.]|uniref:YciI family protein n=1 Tax=Pseudonocardia sp. TaxID=60912 RepID=UPI003D0E1E6C
MTRYLLSIYQPDATPPPEDLATIMAEVGALNREMRDAGVWVFGAGLHHPSTATVVRAQDGEVLTTDGPFAEAKEYLGGFTVLEAPDLDAALAWAGRLARTLRSLPVEVRPFVDERPCDEAADGAAESAAESAIARG